jgi:hypothetical protein
VGVPEILDHLFPVIQKFCAGPEILDQCFFRSYRTAVHVPEILDAVFGVMTNCCARSSISEKVVLIRTKESGCSRNSGSVISRHTKILCWSRNSGQCFFRSWEGGNSLVQKMRLQP